MTDVNLFSVADLSTHIFLWDPDKTRCQMAHFRLDLLLGKLANVRFINSATVFWFAFTQLPTPIPTPRLHHANGIPSFVAPHHVSGTGASTRFSRRSWVVRTLPMPPSEDPSVWPTTWSQHSPHRPIRWNMKRAWARVQWVRVQWALALLPPLRWPAVWAAPHRQRHPQQPQRQPHRSQQRRGVRWVGRW